MKVLDLYENQSEDADRLEEIREQIKELLEESRDILREYSGAYDRADSYWLAHMTMALDREHQYMGRNMVTMDDTVNELRRGSSDEDEDDE